MAAPTPSLVVDQGQTALQKHLDGPARPPPAGVIPNFDNPQNSLGTAIHVIMGLAIGFATCAVFLRVFTKRIILRSMEYEDYTSVIAWICLIGFAVPASLWQKSGIGIHMWDLSFRQFSRMLYWTDISAIVYFVTMVFVKVSILLQYLRIFVPSRNGNLPLFVAIHLCMWIVIIVYLVFTFFDIFLCTPRAKLWDPSITTGHCFDGNDTFEASGIFNVVSDLIILILPMPTLWRLQLSLKRRLLTMGVFAAGFFACIASILRTCYIWQVFNPYDVSWELAPVALWTWVELSIGIIVGCLPSLPKFFQYIGPKIYRSGPGTASGRENVAASYPPRSNILNRVKRPFDKYGFGSSVSDPSDDPSIPRAQLHDKYFTLDEFDASPSRGLTLSTTAGQPGATTTARDP